MSFGHIAGFEKQYDFVGILDISQQMDFLKAGARSGRRVGVIYRLPGSEVFDLMANEYEMLVVIHSSNLAIGCPVTLRGGRRPGFLTYPMHHGKQIPCRV